MTFYERLQMKIKEKGETVKSTEKQCGMANATIQKWQKQSPRLENVAKVAKFLNISLDWLVYGEENKSEEEIELLNNYSKLSQRDKKEIQAIIKLKIEQKDPEGIILNSKTG